MSDSLLSLVRVPHPAATDPWLFSSSIISASDRPPAMPESPAALPSPSAALLRESLFSPLCTEWRLSDAPLRASAATRRTQLGQKLEALRKQALARGLKLFGEEEILEEVRLRRGEQR